MIAAKDTTALLYQPLSYRSSKLSVALSSFCSSRNISIMDVVTIDEEDDYKSIYRLVREVVAGSKRLTFVTNRKLKDSLSLHGSWLKLLEIEPKLLKGKDIYDMNQIDVDELKFYITEVKARQGVANLVLSYLT